MIATKYNEKMNKDEFIKGFMSVMAMANYYFGKYQYETAGSKMAAEYYGEYYDANPELCEEIEADL